MDLDPAAHASRLTIVSFNSLRFAPPGSGETHSAAMQQSLPVSLLGCDRIRGAGNSQSTTIVPSVDVRCA